MFRPSRTVTHRPRARHLRRNSGFTVTEILLALAVAGVLAVVAVPSFRGFVASQRVTSANTDYLGALLRARSEAVKRNLTVSLCATDAPDAAEASLQCNATATGWESGFILFANARGSATTIDRDGDASDGHCSEDDDCVLAAYPALAGMTLRGANTASGAGADVTRYIGFRPNGASDRTGTPYFTVCSDGASVVRAVQVATTGRPQSVSQTPAGAALACP